MNKGLTLIELLVLIVVIGILAALIPPCCGKLQRSKEAACANNLLQLWKLQHVYMTNFGGSNHAMPSETGAAFWKALTKTRPPLIDATINDIFFCPVKRDSDSDACDYGGPAKSIGGLNDADPVGADLPNNHKDGRIDQGSGNVLRKSGDVIELEGRDWVKFTSDPLFPMP